MQEINISCRPYKDHTLALLDRRKRYPCNHKNVQVIKWILSGEDASCYPSIPDEKLSNISSQIPGHDAERFILQYLRLQEPMLSHIKETDRGDTVKILFESLVRWRNMQECKGEHTGPLLDDLLQQFNKKHTQQPTKTGMPFSGHDGSMPNADQCSQCFSMPINTDQCQIRH